MVVSKPFSPLYRIVLYCLFKQNHIIKNCMEIDSQLLTYHSRDFIGVYCLDFYLKIIIFVILL